MSQIWLIDANQQSMLVGGSYCIDFDVFVIEMILYGDVPETQLSNNCLVSERIFIEDVVRTVVQGRAFEMQALGFVPIGRKGIDHYFG